MDESATWEKIALWSMGLLINCYDLPLLIVDPVQFQVSPCNFEIIA